MLRTRLISVLVLLPTIIGFLALGGWWFWVFILVALMAAAWEYCGLQRAGGRAPYLSITWLVILVPLIDLVVPSIRLLQPGLAGSMLIGLGWAMHRFVQSDKDAPLDWALAIAGGLYLGLLGSNFVRLRNMPDGLYWSVLAYGSTWLTDSGAYVVGKAWGRHKLTPKLSPGKTWEGVVGGLFAGSVMTTLLAAVFGLGAWHGLAIGVMVATLSPVGDLAVSMLKRQVGAKDSGTLIPGHGGAFDRIDTLLVSVTLVTLYVSWVV